MKNKTTHPRLVLPPGGLVIDGISIHSAGPATGHSTLALSRPEDYNGKRAFSPVMYATVPSSNKFSVGKILDRLPDNAVLKKAAPEKFLKTVLGKKSLPKSVLAKLGFNQVLHLCKKDKYTGSADIVMLVSNEYQVVAADAYRGANYKGKIVDIAVCENFTIQEEQLGKRAAIYHYSGGCH
jgi:hypothetical protein